MRNTRKSGQILRSKKRPRRTLRSGRGSRTNSNTSHQIPARVIEADSARAVDEGHDLDRRRPPLRAKDLEHEAGTRDAAKNHPRMDGASEGQATDQRDRPSPSLRRRWSESHPVAIRTGR